MRRNLLDHLAQNLSSLIVQVFKQGLDADLNDLLGNVILHVELDQ